MSGPRGKNVPIMGALLSLGIAAGALTLSKDLRYSAYTCIGRNKTKIILRSLGLLALLASFKNFPFVWHYRIFRAFVYQIYIQRHPWQPRHLFAPMITSSWNSLFDCDYNFHKSNSTYFADLDIARAHLVAALVRVGIRRLNRGDEEGLPQDTKTRVGSYNVALGGVACMFQREVEPMAQFEVYTRVLSWDRKWIYIVSHMVRAGKIKPEGYIMQPWRKGEKNCAAGLKQEEEDLSKFIYASSISRYVVKKGRITINPEIVLERSRLLPPKPAGVELPPRSESTADSPPSSDTPVGEESRTQISGPEQVAATLTSKFGSNGTTSSEPVDSWSWDEMEKERLRGLKLASHFDALSGLSSELRAGEVLGRFSDWI
ncbi:hypothetical protein AMS68_007907 [Peltaster fructicola]|uniref:Uncharacterized protein n=1 Tax=Peltaster fructicola TaxID=286661 RepID=A0A6H0Y709_9PEZI|nr:hypothetical protein AMS68_007907 [Peltaster fructicola]